MQTRTQIQKPKETAKKKKKKTHKSEPRCPNSNPRLRSQRIETVASRNPRRQELQRATDPQPFSIQPPASPIASLPEHRRDRALQHHRRHCVEEHSKKHQEVEHRLLPLQPGQALAVESGRVRSTAVKNRTIVRVGLDSVPLQRETAADRAECAAAFSSASTVVSLRRRRASSHRDRPKKKFLFFSSSFFSRKWQKNQKRV